MADKKKEKNEINITSYTAHITSGGISDLTNIKPSYLSNMKKIHEDFPKNMNKGGGSPYYYYGDVVNWACNNGIEIQNRPVLYRDVEYLQSENMFLYLNIAIMGGARTGKTFIASYFLKDTVFIRQILLGVGKARTIIPVKIVAGGFNSYFQFRILDKEIEDSLPLELQEYKNSKVLINPGSPDFGIAFKGISSWIWQLYKNGITDLEKKITLEIAGEASEMAKDILARTGKYMIVITDTPGEPFDPVYNEIHRQDLVIVSFTDYNMELTQKDIDQARYYAGSAPVILSFRMFDRAESEKEYLKLEEQANEYLKNNFSGFEKGDITSFDKEYNASDRMVVMPLYYSSTYKDYEDLYTKRLSEIIVREYNNKISPQRISDVKDEAGISKEEIAEFLDKIMYVPKTNPLNKETHDKAVEKFKKASHGRSKTEDKYRVINIVDKYILKEKEKLTEIFNGLYEQEDISEWQRFFIAYVYCSLDRALTTYHGIGREIEVFQDPLAITMKTYESIFAEELYEELKDYKEKIYVELEEWGQFTIRYREALKRCGILSDTWGTITANNCAVYHLYVLKESGLLECGCDPEKSEEDLIRNCAVAGQLFQTIVNIYADVYRAIGMFKDIESIIHLVKKKFDEKREEQ